MAYMCDIVLICLHFIIFGLEYDLLWFLIESQSFWLLIHLISSPNDVATLLFVLILWVVFVFIFWDEFSTFSHTFIVIVVHKIVMIRNPKTDSKLKFRGRDTAEERKRSAGGTSEANGQACWPRVPHGQLGSLPTSATHGPHMRLTWHSVVGRSIFSHLLPFKYSNFPPFHFKKKKIELTPEFFLSIFLTFQTS